LLIYLDYDGVLVDSFSRLLGLAREIQGAMGAGRPPTAEDLRTISNLTLEELGRMIGIRGEKTGEFAAGMFRLLRKDPKVPAVWSGIPCVLNRLSQSHTLVVLTGNAHEAVQRTLVRNGLDGCIREIMDGESPGSKAEKIQSSRKRFGFEANQTFMIGDALSDVKAGKKAGVITVAVTWGFQPREKLAEGNPDYIVDKPAEIPGIIGP
jgi:phosphoglycolate phosphatase-like HAD superfamily hydrolase